MDKKKEQDEKLEAKWRKILEQFLSNIELKEYVSPPALSPKDRRMIHLFAEENNLFSESRGEI